VSKPLLWHESVLVECLRAGLCPRHTVPLVERDGELYCTECQAGGDEWAISRFMVLKVDRTPS
jgi:uncharacterized Zn finger protein (UPF0148 family)